MRRLLKLALQKPELAATLLLRVAFLVVVAVAVPAGALGVAVVAAALAWQLKLRSAQALLLQAPFSAPEGRRYWTDPTVFPVRAASIAAAVSSGRFQ